MIKKNRSFGSTYKTELTGLFMSNARQIWLKFTGVINTKYVINMLYRKLVICDLKISMEEYFNC